MINLNTFTREQRRVLPARRKQKQERKRQKVTLHKCDPGSANRLGQDGWVCMERTDLLRGERFTGLKKQ